MVKLYVGTAVAGKYQLDKAGLINIGKVLLYSALSAIIASLIALIPNIDVPTQYLFLIPIVNTILVAIKKFLEE